MQLSDRARQKIVRIYFGTLAVLGVSFVPTVGNTEDELNAGVLETSGITGFDQTRVGTTDNTVGIIFDTYLNRKFIVEFKPNQKPNVFEVFETDGTLTLKPISDTNPFFNDQYIAVVKRAKQAAESAELSGHNPDLGNIYNGDGNVRKGDSSVLGDFLNFGNGKGNENKVDPDKIKFPNGKTLSEYIKTLKPNFLSHADTGPSRGAGI